MTTEMVCVLALLGMAIVMFSIDRPRMDAVALIVLCLLPMTGVVSMNEALAGFSDPNVILIAAMFVLGDALVRTGVARMMGDWLVKRAGRSETRLTALMMAAVCALGATMSSTAVTAIFIPIVLRICRITRMSPGRLMMPLSMAALISGMMTLVATAPNLVVNAELIRRGDTGFGFFAFTPFGLPILALGIAYMQIARRWLPEGAHQDNPTTSHRPTLDEWAKRYNLAQREHRLRVRFGSPLIGVSLDEIGLRQTASANLVAIQRGHKLIQPKAKTQLEEGDILLVDFFETPPDVDNVRERYGLETVPLTGAHFADRSQEIGMVEAIVPADSELLGKSIVNMSFRSRYGMSLIGLRRGQEPIQSGLRDEKLKVGDTLLLIGPWKSVRNLKVTGGRDLMPLNLPAEFDDVAPVSGRSAQALLTLALVVAAMVTGIIPNVQAALLGCLLMGSFRCIDFESAYKSIDWKTLVLIVGMLPFSLALERTGGISAVSDLIIRSTSGIGSYGILATLFLATSVLSLFMSNTATAVLMTPVALTVADHLNASPKSFAMIVALSASASFSTPVSSPVNTLVFSPGGYRFGDFVRIGLPFTLLTMIVSVILVGQLLPP
jgi:di/tricarboxylate transporter